jgi:hypothetical protein
MGESFRNFLFLPNLNFMKTRIQILAALVFALSFTACHYGADAVKEDVKRNEEYKGKRAETEAATALPDNAAESMGATSPISTTDSSSTQ